jgi:hypothetical protein
MIVHVVLFRPRPGLSDSDREAMFTALRSAATHITTVRRFHVGARITHGAVYEGLMSLDFPFAAMIEFDDLEGLKAYLGHPQHDSLGELFYRYQEAALVYDYEVGPVAGLT